MSERRGTAWPCLHTPAALTFADRDSRRTQIGCSAAWPTRRGWLPLRHPQTTAGSPAGHAESIRFDSKHLFWVFLLFFFLQNLYPSKTLGSFLLLATLAL